MRWIDQLHDMWNAKPLVFRLVGLIVTLLTFGVTVSGTVMVGLLQRHLIEQIDSQLLSSAEALANRTHGQSLDDALGESDSPTSYYIRYKRLGDQNAHESYFAITIKDSGHPSIPELIELDDRPASQVSATQPVTVSSSKAGATWRAMAIPMEIRSTDQFVGVVTIALPLTNVQHTMRTTSAYFSLVGLVIVASGGFLGRYLVRHALTGLRHIESTAGKIAAGDLTQRIDPEPPTTEVGSLGQSLNTMLSQVEQSFQARHASERKIRRFVSDASHELRTPLAAIRGYCELYSLGGVPEDRIPDIMSRIQSESTRMGNLVEDLLTLARLDEGRPLDFIELDLVEMAEHAAFDLRALDPQREVLVRGLGKHPLPRELLVTADRDRIQQVFTNLIGNIVRYTPAGSPVELAVGMRDRNAIIEFRDHGPGIAAKDHERVWERFYRAEDSRARSLGGSGLGLSIVSGIMRAHHGAATLSHTNGGGLTVRIALPLDRKEANDTSSSKNNKATR